MPCLARRAALGSAETPRRATHPCRGSALSAPGSAGKRDTSAGSRGRGKPPLPAARARTSPSSADEMKADVAMAGERASPGRQSEQPPSPAPNDNRSQPQTALEPARCRAVKEASGSGSAGPPRSRGGRRLLPSPRASSQRGPSRSSPPAGPAAPARCSAPAPWPHGRPPLARGRPSAAAWWLLARLGRARLPRPRAAERGRRGGGGAGVSASGREAAGPGSARPFGERRGEEKSCLSRPCALRLRGGGG